MPRPGPRPYECVRRAWHSDAHQPLRASLTQEIFRIVTEFHSSETRSKKEWQEKLPIVVLRAEEILYSKARTEEEYADFSTLKFRLEDAVNTMIRRTDDTSSGSKDGPYMEPCVEAALSLGCTPKINPRSQRPCNARLSSSSNTKRGGSSPTPIISREGPTSPNAPAVASYLTNIVARSDLDKGWPPTKVVFGAAESCGATHEFASQATASSLMLNLNDGAVNFRGRELVPNEFENWQTCGPSYHQQRRQQFPFSSNHNASPTLGMIFSPLETTPAITFPMQPQLREEATVPSLCNFESPDHGRFPRTSGSFVTYGPPSTAGASPFQAGLLGSIFPGFGPPPPPVRAVSEPSRTRGQRKVEDDLELCLAPPKGNLDTASLSWRSEGCPQQVGAERLPCLKRKSPLHEDKRSDVTSFDANKRLREYPY